MEIDKWVSNSYDRLLSISKKITRNSGLSEELLHYSLEILLTKPNVQEIIDSGAADYYVIKIFTNSWKSDTSPFSKIHRNKKQKSLDLYLYKIDVEADTVEADELTAKKATQLLSEMDWYSRELFMLYTNECVSISQLSRSTGIPRTSVSLTINRVRKYLKKELKK